MSDRLLLFLSRTEVWAIVVGVGGFLALSWLIRGAPLGQAARPEPVEAPPPGYRDRVVAGTVASFLLVLAGAYLAVAVGIPWSLPAFASGFGGLIAVGQVNHRYRHASPTLRRAMGFASAALTFSLVAGLLVLGNVVAFRYGGRPLDLTRDRSYSLETLTLNQLRSLDRPLKITTFFGDSERSRRQHERVRQLLDLYKAANPSRVEVESLDPFHKDLQRYEGLVNSIPEIAAMGTDGMVLTYGDGDAAPHAVLGTRDLFQAEPGRSEANPNLFVSRFNGEDVVTSALIRLREGKRTRVAFTGGHGEPSTSELDASQQGLGLWKVRLAATGSDPVEVNLIRDDVPPDVALLMICGPKSPFQPGEVDRLRAFLGRGGQVIACLGGNAPTGLEALLRAYNVEFGPGLAVDPRYNLKGRPYFVYAPIVGASVNPLTRPIANQAVLLQNASPIVILGPGEKPGAAPAQRKPYNPGVSVTPILRTRPESWAETDQAARPPARDPDRDVAGPLVVGVGVLSRPTTSSEQPVPRMVIFSSPVLADNRIVRLEPTNLDLLMGAVQWLRGRPELSGISARTHESLTFAADPGLQLRLVMVPTLMAIVLIIGLGLATYLARRD